MLRITIPSEPVHWITLLKSNKNNEKAKTNKKVVKLTIK